MQQTNNTIHFLNSTSFVQTFAPTVSRSLSIVSQFRFIIVWNNAVRWTSTSKVETETTIIVTSRRHRHYQANASVDCHTKKKRGTGALLMCFKAMTTIRTTNNDNKGNGNDGRGNSVLMVMGALINC